jgi:hypothetical protein
MIVAATYIDGVKAVDTTVIDQMPAVKTYNPQFPANRVDQYVQADSRPMSRYTTFSSYLQYTLFEMK